VDRLKSILTNKLNNDLFKTLHNSNLENIFDNPANIFTPLENYKNYILNKLIIINHTYLWDFFQRPTILFEEGVNIFIFDNTNLYCPFGENISQFYNPNRKNILIYKNKEYYEPIYYLEGDGKNAIKTCIFENNRIEIKKIFEISNNGCKPKFDIDWLDVLKHNIKRYDLNIDNLVFDLGDDLEKVLTLILQNIKNKNLNESFLPVLQYVDNYNKVFGIKLKNGLYVPIAPSKLIYKFKYEIINDIAYFQKLSYNDVIKLTNILVKSTGLKCNITHKILDLKDKKYINALVNEKNRFIPIKKSINNDKSLKISNLNYYTDVDTSLKNKIKIPDNRVELINKSKFEDENFIRMKFELSNFLQLPKNKNILKSIFEIIYSNEKDININRSKLYVILNKIFNELIIINTKDLDYNNYTPLNERMPCFLRSNKKETYDKNNKDSNLIFSCEDDPHCRLINKNCKLFINKKNLLNIHRNIENYTYYISRIIDELLRFKIKQYEILYNKIPSTINKELIEHNNDNYIIIHTLNPTEINNIIDKLYYDNKGIILDERNLYEEITTKEYGFKKGKYVKTNIGLLEDFKSEQLTIYWDKYFDGKFDVRLNDEDTLFSIISLSLNNTIDFKNFKNEKITVQDIKSNIVKYLKQIYESKNKMKNINKDNNNISNNIENKSIIDLYKNNCSKKFKYITSLQSLYSEILNEDHTGCEIDLELVSKIYKVNIIILEKRHKKDKSNYKFIKNKNSLYYIILYKKIIIENFFYNIIKSKNKYIFKQNELPSKFVNNFILKRSNIDNNNDNINNNNINNNDNNN
jgi:hypothetical protein